MLSPSPVFSHIKTQPTICLELLWLVNCAWFVQISLLIQTRPLFNSRKRYYGLWTLILGNNVLMMDLILKKHSFSLLKMLTDGLDWSGLLVDYYDVFISCLDSHSDGTHSLQRIHCWDTDAETRFSKSEEEVNSSTFRMAWGWVIFFSKYSLLGELSFKILRW